MLLGFSSGGGYALHVAGTPLAKSFERIVLLSPMLGPFAPTVKQIEKPWAVPFIPRIVALTILERIGIRAFEHLPALVFAVPPRPELTAFYSFVLMSTFGTRDYAADLRNAGAPLAVVVGADDELFAADRFATVLNAERPGIPVTVVPGLGHIALTTDPRAYPAIIAAVKGAGR